MNQKKARPGRPAKSDIDRLQTKLWASAVLLASGMKPDDYERHLLEKVDPEDGPYKELTKKWSRYSNGSQFPKESISIGGKTYQGVISLADADTPGSARWIRTPLWRVLKQGTLSISEASELIKSIPCTGITDLFCLPDQDDGNKEGAQRFSITAHDWTYLSCISSIDAFSAMLVYLRSVLKSDRSVGIADCQWWLHNAYLQHSPIRKHQEEFVAVLNKYAPELGDLKYLGVCTPNPFALG